jgi:heat shock protein HslJ
MRRYARSSLRLCCASIIAVVAITLLSACGTRPGESGAAPAPAATSAPAPGALAGTQWALIALEQGGSALPLIQGTRLTLQFGADGAVGGMAGCNSFGGTYTLNGSTLTLGELRQTLKACDQAIMQQEARYTDALKQAQSFTLEGTQLTITSPGRTLRFTRA